MCTLESIDLLPKCVVDPRVQWGFQIKREGLVIRCHTEMVRVGGANGFNLTEVPDTVIIQAICGVNQTVFSKLQPAFATSHTVTVADWDGKGTCRVRIGKTGDHGTAEL